jgi:hypothetical protein
MQKQVISVKVRTDEEGRIRITQADYGDKDEDQVIIVMPEQVELLCKHLKEAADELGRPIA